MIQHNCSQQDNSIHRMLTALAWEECQVVPARHTKNCRAPQNYKENFILVKLPLLITGILLQLIRKHKISCILNKNVGSRRNNLINNDLLTVPDISGWLFCEEAVTQQASVSCMLHDHYLIKTHLINSIINHYIYSQYTITQCAVNAHLRVCS